MTRVGILSDRARIIMSVCVVALPAVSYYRGGGANGVPKGIADDEQRDVFRVCVSQDLIALSLDHVSVSKDEFFPIERFLA